MTKQYRIEQMSHDKDIYEVQIRTFGQWQGVRTAYSYNEASRLVEQYSSGNLSGAEYTHDLANWYAMFMWFIVFAIVGSTIIAGILSSQLF